MLYEDKMCFHIRVTFKLLAIETEVGITGWQTYSNEINNWHSSSETKTPSDMLLISGNEIKDDR